MGAIYPAGVTGISGETLSLTNALASLGIPGIETKQAILYAPSVDFRLHINPAIRRAYFYDHSAANNARFTDLTRVLTDRTATGTGTTLDSLQTTDSLFICFSDVVGGMYVDMTASVNASASLITGNYWNGTAWTDSSVTDATVASSGKSLGQDGSITFTAPTTWLRSRFNQKNSYKANQPFIIVDSVIDTDEVLDATEDGVDCDGDATTAIPAGSIIRVETELMYVSATGTSLTVVRGYLGSTAATHTTNQDIYVWYNGNDIPSEEGMWYQWTFSGAMGADVEIQDLWALNKDANRGYFRAGVEYPISFDRRNVGAIEAILAASTDTLQVTWVKCIV